MAPQRIVDWLLDSDPALRWQVERDLVGADRAVWTRTRARVSREGFGAKLLAQQDADGQWAGGAFFPAAFAGDRPQPWTATTWCLNDLREWGVGAEVLPGTAEKLGKVSWEYDDLPYWQGEVDACINSWTLSNGLWLGADVDGIVEWFLKHQLADGGWNCEWINGAHVGSFHSTLNSLLGLLDYQLHFGDAGRVAAARTQGEEYLLSRSLFRRLSTGQPYSDLALSLAHPRRAYYNILAAADYFRRAAIADSRPPDPRMKDAIEIIRSQRHVDGAWLQGHRLDGDVWFHIDAPAGEASKWVTFQSMRVLKWWGCFFEQSSGDPAPCEERCRSAGPPELP